MRDLSGGHIEVYVARDTIGEIHKRVQNLLRGREFTVVRHYVDQPAQFPRVSTGLRLDVEAYRGEGQGIRFSANANSFGACYLTILATPGIEMVGIYSDFGTEVEARSVDHAQEHRLRNRETMCVEIVGGTDPQHAGRDSVINIYRTNENGVSETVVIKPRVLEANEVAEAEGAFLDRVEAYCLRTDSVVNATTARKMAETVRYSWASPLNGTPVMTPEDDAV